MRRSHWILRYAQNDKQKGWDVAIPARPIVTPQRFAASALNFGVRYSAELSSEASCM